MGPRAGQKVFTLQTVPAEPPEEPKKGVAQAAGFSLPYRDGTTHIVLEPLDFIARLAALVPPPRALTRLHGVCGTRGAARGDHAGRKRVGVAEASRGA